MVGARVSRKAIVLAAAIPAAAGLAWSLLLQPEVETLATPAMGPWAGKALGHDECTMASSAPELTIAAVASVAVAATLLLASGRFRGRLARVIVPLVVAAASSIWSASAFLSVLNTKS